mgnify:CR=1 FL=1
MLGNIVISLFGIALVLTFICAVYDDKHNSNTHLVPFIVAVILTILSFCTHRVDYVNKSSAVIYKNKADAKVEIASPDDETVKRKITAGDIIKQSTLEDFKDHVWEANVTISKGNYSSIRNDVDVEVKDLNKPTHGKMAKIEKVTYSASDVYESVLGFRHKEKPEKTVTVYVRYIDSNSQKELDDLYGDNK